MFDRRDGCEYVFMWRTSEACPVKKSQGERLQNDCCLDHFNDQELKMPIGDAISFFQVTTVRSATPGVVMFLTSDL